MPLIRAALPSALKATMAKITGGLFSLDASGTIADTLTYSKWKGIGYARQRVIPANPRSTDQTDTRQVFSFLQSLYKRLPAIGSEPWIAAAVGNPMTPINVFLKHNISGLRSQIDLDNMVLSPGNAGGLPPVTMILTPGSGTITVAITAPSPPAGWTLTAAQAIAVKDQDPHDAVEEAPQAGEDLSSAYSIVLSGLTTAAPYQVGGWLKWLTSTGRVAYSVALRDTETPS